MKFKRLAAAVMAAVLAVSTVPLSGLATEKKDTGSKQLLATTLRSDSQSARNGKVKLSLNAEKATMKLGEKKTLTVTVATASNATASDSDAIASASNAIEWVSSSGVVTVTPDDDNPKKAEVEVVGYQKDAEPVTITAFVKEVPGVNATAECKVTISAPTLNVKTPTTIEYDEQAEVTVKMTNVDPSWQMDMDNLSFSCQGPVVAETKNEVTTISNDGTGVFGKAAITATYAITEDWKIVSNTAEVTLKQPELTVTADRTTIDMKEQKQLTLEIVDNVYADYQWTVNDPSVASISGNGKTAVLTAKKDGTVNVTATGKVGETFKGAKATIKITIKDSREFVWAEEQEDPVKLYLNNEEKSDTATLNIINDFAKANWSLSNDEVAEIAVSEDGKSATVTAKAAGAVKLNVTAEGAQDLVLNILVVDSAENVEVVGGETVVNVPDEVINNIEIPEFDTEGLTDEEKAYLEANREKFEGQVREAVAEIITSIMENEAANALPPTGLDAALKAAGILEDGEKAAVYLMQEVKEIQITTVTVVENGEVKVIPVITGMVFDITPHMASVDENGAIIEGTAQNVADAINAAKKTITLTIPVPAGVEFNYAQILHQGSTTTARIIKTDDGNYIRTSVRHFSEFKITFTDEAPYTGGGSGGSSGSRSSKAYVPVEPGQWILNEIGWWYKYNDGTYPAGQWALLPWNGVNTWYYFDAQGYLVTGWLQDGGNTYYLHPTSDGNRGAMYTGWHQIDGKWYYFHTMEGGPLGAMVVNTQTPDGFTVGADGVWIQ